MTEEMKSLVHDALERARESGKLEDIEHAATAPNQPAVQASWSSPTSTITIASTPGTSQSVILNCPPLVKSATFGIPIS